VEAAGNSVVSLDYDEVVRRGVRALGKVGGRLLVENAAVEAASGGLVEVSDVTQCLGSCFFRCGLVTGSLESRDGDVGVDGDLRAGGLVEVREGRLMVGGTLTAERVKVRKSLEIKGGLDAGDVSVGGSLQVEGPSKAGRIDVGGSVECASGLDADLVDVGGSVRVSGATRSSRIDVGGKFVGDGVVADDVDVGGSFEAGEVDVGKIDVGGTIRLGGGVVRREADVGGRLESSKPLGFERLDAGGKIWLSGGEGGEIRAGGSLTNSGALKFSAIQVGGTVELDGDASGQAVEVGGTLSVHGGLKLSGGLRVGGKADVSVGLEAGHVRVGGSVRADSINARTEIQSNSIYTVKGAKAARIEIGRRGEARGPLVADEIVIGDDAEVDDIYGGVVTLRRGSRVGNVYAVDLRVENNVEFRERVMYSDHLRLDRRVSFSAPPEKTEKLPQPPL
jgi:hypothetical protein